MARRERPQPRGRADPLRHYLTNEAYFSGTLRGQAPADFLRSKASEMAAYVCFLIGEMGMQPDGRDAFRARQDFADKWAFFLRQPLESPDILRPKSGKQQKEEMLRLLFPVPWARDTPRPDRMSDALGLLRPPWRDVLDAARDPADMRRRVLDAYGWMDPALDELLPRPPDSGDEPPDVFAARLMSRVLALAQLASPPSRITNDQLEERLDLLVDVAGREDLGGVALDVPRFLALVPWTAETGKEIEASLDAGGEPQGALARAVCSDARERARARLRAQCELCEDPAAPYELARLMRAEAERLAREEGRDPSDTAAAEDAYAGRLTAELAAVHDAGADRTAALDAGRAPSLLRLLDEAARTGLEGYTLDDVLAFAGLWAERRRGALYEVPVGGVKRRPVCEACILERVEYTKRHGEARRAERGYAQPFEPLGNVVEEALPPFLNPWSQEELVRFVYRGRAPGLRRRGAGVGGRGGSTQAEGVPVRTGGVYRTDWGWLSNLLGPYGLSRGALVLYRSEPDLAWEAANPGPAEPPAAIRFRSPVFLGRALDYDADHFERNDLETDEGLERAGRVPTRLVVQPLYPVAPAWRGGGGGVLRGYVPVESVRVQNAFPLGGLPPSNAAVQSELHPLCYDELGPTLHLDERRLREALSDPQPLAALDRLIGDRLLDLRTVEEATGVPTDRTHLQCLRGSWRLLRERVSTLTDVGAAVAADVLRGVAREVVYPSSATLRDAGLARPDATPADVRAALARTVRLAAPGIAPLSAEAPEEWPRAGGGGGGGSPEVELRRARERAAREGLLLDAPRAYEEGPAPEDDQKRLVLRAVATKMRALLCARDAEGEIAVDGLSRAVGDLALPPDEADAIAVALAGGLLGADFPLSVCDARGTSSYEIVRRAWDDDRYGVFPASSPGAVRFPGPPTAIGRFRDAGDATRALETRNPAHLRAVRSLLSGYAWTATVYEHPGFYRGWTAASPAGAEGPPPQQALLKPQAGRNPSPTLPSALPAGFVPVEGLPTEFGLPARVSPVQAAGAREKRRREEEGARPPPVGRPTATYGAARPVKKTR